MPRRWTLSPEAELDEAITWFRKRVAMSPKELAALQENARRQGFWMAKVASAQRAKRIQDSLQDALAHGMTFETWRRTNRGILGRIRTDHLQTTFRNWTQTSYNAARVDYLSNPAVLKRRPYWVFDAVLDGNTTPVCVAYNATVLPAKHPWFLRHTPPLHHNCRSSIRGLTNAQAERLGIRQRAPAPKLTAAKAAESGMASGPVSPQSGFGTHMVEPWKPKMSELPKGAKRLVERPPRVVAKAPAPVSPIVAPPNVQAPKAPVVTVQKPKPAPVTTAIPKSKPQPKVLAPKPAAAAPQEPAPAPKPAQAVKTPAVPAPRPESPRAKEVKVTPRPERIAPAPVVAKMPEAPRPIPAPAPAPKPNPEPKRPTPPAPKPKPVKVAPAIQLPDRAKSGAEWIAGLSEEQRIGVDTWTKGGHRAIRAIDAGRVPTPEQVGYGDFQDVGAARIAHGRLMSALETAPVHRGRIYRGVGSLSQAELVSLTAEGAEVEFDAISSWSDDGDVAKNFAVRNTGARRAGPGTVVFELRPKSGAYDISELSNIKSEREVVVMKNTKYRVVRTEPFTGRFINRDIDGTVVVLEEVT